MANVRFSHDDQYLLSAGGDDSWYDCMSVCWFVINKFCSFLVAFLSGNVSSKSNFF